MARQIGFLLIIICGSLQAQTGSIIGRVFVDHLPVAGAHVSIQGLGKGTTTDITGHFSLTNLIPGEHQMQISFLGCQKWKTVVQLENNVKDLGEIRLKEDPLQLSEIVVSTTRSEVLRIDAPIVCNLLDERIFEATQSVVLAEGLSFQPALRIENNCQNCGFTALRMNGLDGAYSQILIDGRPIFSSLQGVYGLEQIPANIIERVEIVRSGGSALYGSSAVAGTVNIITKEASRNSGYVSVNQSFINGETPDLNLAMGADVVGNQKKYGITIHGFGRSRQEWDANADGFSEIGQIRAQALSLKAFYKPTGRSKISLNGYRIYEFRRGGNKFHLPYHQADITEALTHHISHGGLTYEAYSLNEKHKLSAYADAQKLGRDSYYGSNQDPNAYGQSNENSAVGGVQYSGELGWFAGGSHTLVAGTEYSHQQLRDDAPAYSRYIRQTISQWGLYFQDFMEMGRFNVLMGGRMDWHNLLDAWVFNPRANVLYKASEKLQLRVGYARGYRAPQVFDEDLHISQVNGLGMIVLNADGLQPEFSDAYSASVDFNRYKDDWSYGVTLDAFHTQLSQVFVLEERDAGDENQMVMLRRNSEGGRVMGVTINPKIQYRDLLNIQFGYTYQQSNYTQAVQWSEELFNEDSRFLRTPDHYGFYVASWEAGQNVTLNFSGVFTGRMLAPHYAGAVESDRLEVTPSFFEHHVKVDYTVVFDEKFTFQWKVGIQNYTNSFQNDFDAGVNRDAGYIYGPSRPRTFFIGLIAQM